MQKIIKLMRSKESVSETAGCVTILRIFLDSIVHFSTYLGTNFNSLRNEMGQKLTSTGYFQQFARIFMINFELCIKNN